MAGIIPMLGVNEATGKGRHTPPQEEMESSAIPAKIFKGLHLFRTSPSQGPAGQTESMCAACASLKQWPFHVVIKAGPGESNVLLTTIIVLKDGGLYFTTAPSPATRASAAVSKDDPLLQEGI
ncbi:hypothetical protein ETB97_009863 [Aspergillus alliaceus]|uniref:Uncharacterized protein n=1 Tax=Petromyces alliaceus TaxID=209559 RepID=A0A8H6E0S8_PETAA|nr:hypothetical protein ETB97_009863 [Aspergillus burnettii]